MAHSVVCLYSVGLLMCSVLCRVLSYIAYMQLLKGIKMRLNVA